MNTMIYSSYTSFGFNDLFCYLRNIKLKKILSNSKLLSKRIELPRGLLWKFGNY